VKLPSRKCLKLVLLALLCTGAAHDDARVTQFVASSGEGRNVVLISKGKDQGVVDGSLMTVYRERPSLSPMTPQGLMVEMGTLKVVQVQDSFAVAEIVAQDIATAKLFFPKYPGVMAGDMVRERALAINPVQIATPALALTFAEIFADPKARPQSFELTEEGKDQLREAAKAFASARLPVLMVEAHTDTAGAAETNQIESQERALAVRQFLIAELKFDSKKVIALGFGESEPAVEDFTPGHRDINRRIVLKALADNPSAAVR